MLVGLVLPFLKRRGGKKSSDFFGCSNRSIADEVLDVVSITRKLVTGGGLRIWCAGVMTLSLTLGAAGCHSTGSDAVSKSRRPPGQPIIRRVVCMYDQRPWLSLDRQGDLDVEGFWFRMFLDPGTGRGILAEGTFHIGMYRLERDATGAISKRTLVSDWHYASTDLPRISKPGMLGDGYVPQLVWSDKGLSGSEVDIVVSFEDVEGDTARAGTKRMRIPVYGK